MGNRFRDNEKKIPNHISEKLLSRKQKNLNVKEQENMQYNSYKTSKKSITKHKYSKLKEKNPYLIINKKCPLNFKTVRENINGKTSLGKEIIKYFIIDILLSRFYIIKSLINLKNDKICYYIILYSYEITLKIKGTGIKNILSSSSSHIYPCPTNIYQNELIFDNTDCHYISTTEPYSNIKLE